MESAYKKIFWGLIIATFSITLGVVTIFPTFVGWLVVLSGVSDLEDQFSDKQFSTVYLSVGALVLLSLAEGFVSISRLPDWVPALPFLFFPVFLSVIELTAFHKILEASADRLRENNHFTSSTVYNRKDKVYLVLMGCSLVLLTAALTANHETLLFFGRILTLIPRVYLLTIMHALSEENLDERLEESVPLEG
ncbi:MAG: hypothetical protein JJU16_01515 [Alkalibacterium sp.]|nr:hypothetical protein [Alkalibacterium sp.]